MHFWTSFMDDFLPFFLSLLASTIYVVVETLVVLLQFSKLLPKAFRSFPVCIIVDL